MALTPERLSVALMQILAGRLEIQLEAETQPVPLEMTVEGAVRSTLRGLVKVPDPTLPALSVAVPVGCWLVPSPTVVLAETEATPEVASVADQATVTALSYQPAPLGPAVGAPLTTGAKVSTLTVSDAEALPSALV